MMDIQAFLGIGIIGVFSAAIIQWIKNKFGLEGTKAKLLTVAFALIMGASFIFIRNTNYFEGVVSILMASSTIYTFFFK